MRHLQLEHHDSDDNGKDAITKSLETILGHGVMLPKLCPKSQSRMRGFERTGETGQLIPTHRICKSYYAIAQR